MTPLSAAGRMSSVGTPNSPCIAGYWVCLTIKRLERLRSSGIHAEVRSSRSGRGTGTRHAALSWVGARGAARCATVLAEHADRVTVVGRTGTDDAGHRARRAAARHPHVLAGGRGQLALESLLPGFLAELRRLGRRQRSGCPRTWCCGRTGKLVQTTADDVAHLYRLRAQLGGAGTAARHLPIR